jgi:hypothetical protein
MSPRINAEALPGDDISVPEVVNVPDQPVNLSEHTESGKPIVRVKPGSLQESVRAAEALLASTEQYFQRGGSIVHVYVDPVTGEAVIQELASLTLVHTLDGLSAWMKYDRRSDTWVHKDPDEKVCKILLKALKFEQLQPLLGVARQPYMRPDGSLCLKSGYDAVTGIYGAFSEGWPAVPDAPSRDEARLALSVLEGILTDVQFASECDKAAALSAFLTAVLRPSLTAAPMYHVRAHQIASGKSYLCMLITALATPQRGSPVGFPSSEEECGKLLLAQLIRSPAVIEFDNITSDLRPYRTLCTALTNDGMEGRVLGRTRVQKVGTRALFLSSGNNVGPIADMTRRCLTVNLDPRCDTPASRTFSRPNLIEEVYRDRQRYVCAALTVVRGWIAAGRPDPGCKAIANFGEWSGNCRQSLMWLGLPDPATAIFEGMSEDPERQLLGELLIGWKNHFGSKPTMVRDVVARSKSDLTGSDELLETLIEITGDRETVNHRKLGRWITRKAGVVVHGLRFVKAPKTRNVENWRVESVVSVTAVASSTD